MLGTCPVTHRRKFSGDLRVRLEAARLDLLALFRALDHMDLSAEEIPQRLLRQLFERDVDYAGPFGRWTRLREAWIAMPCSAIPSPHWTGCRQRAQNFGNNYPPVPSIRTALNPTQAYNMVPGRDPENG